jgi:hypothetical protein
LIPFLPDGAAELCDLQSQAAMFQFDDTAVGTILAFCRKTQAPTGAPGRIK